VAGGPILRRFFNGQVDLLDESLIVGEDRFVLGDFLYLPVQALDGVRRIDQSLNLRRIFEEGHDLFPVVAPGNGDMRVAFVPFFRELLKRRGPIFFRGGLVDPPQVLGHGVAFFPGHVPERVTDLMDDAFLNLGPGKDGLDSLRDPLEVIDSEDEDREPVLGRFRLGDPQPQAFLLAVEVYPDDRVLGIGMGRGGFGTRLGKS